MSGDSGSTYIGQLKREPVRSWKSSDDTTMRCYLGMEGRITLRELVDHFTETYPHVDPMSLHKRHLRNNENACRACLQANARRKAGSRARR